MNEDIAEPLLSSDETQALLAAMRSSAANNQSAKELELGSTDQRVRQSLERADEVGKEFAAEMRKMLRRVTGIAHTVREGTADVVPFNVFASSTPQGTGIGTLKLAGKLVGFVMLGPRVTVRVLSRRLGGAVPGADAPEEEPRVFLSPVDRRIARPFIGETVELFTSLWSKDDPGLELGDVLARAADLPRLLPQFEPLLRLPMTISVTPEQSEEMCVVLTSAAVPSVTPAVEPEPAMAPVNNVDRARLAARLAHAEVEVVAVLGHARSTVRDVLRLNVGDVIRLNEPPDAPIRVSVEGREKLFGLPVVRHGNLAIEVIKVLKGAP
jgi:flagellar motor switch protein FliM